MQMTFKSGRYCAWAGLGRVARHTTTGREGNTKRKRETRNTEIDGNGATTVLCDDSEREHAVRPSAEAPEGPKVVDRRSRFYEHSLWPPGPRRSSEGDRRTNERSARRGGHSPRS